MRMNLQCVGSERGKSAIQTEESQRIRSAESSQSMELELQNGQDETEMKQAPRKYANDMQMSYVCRNQVRRLNHSIIFFFTWDFIFSFHLHFRVPETKNSFQSPRNILQFATFP